MSNCATVPLVVHKAKTDNYTMPNTNTLITIIPSYTLTLIHKFNPVLTKLRFSVLQKKKKGKEKKRKGKQPRLLIFLVIFSREISPVLRQEQVWMWKLEKKWFLPLDMTTDEELLQWWQKQEMVPVFMQLSRPRSRFYLSLITSNFRENAHKLCTQCR